MSSPASLLYLALASLYACDAVPGLSLFISPFAVSTILPACTPPVLFAQLDTLTTLLPLPPSPVDAGSL